MFHETDEAWKRPPSKIELQDSRNCYCEDGDVMSLFVHVPRTAVAGARAAQPKTGAPFRAGGPRWTLFVLGRGRLAW